MSDILLILPPVWDLYSPYISLPAISAFLKKKSVSVQVWDANIELFDYMISDAYLGDCMERMEKALSSMVKGDPKSLDLRKNLEMGALMHGQVDKIKQSMRRYDKERSRLIHSKNMLENMKSIISGGHWPRDGQTICMLSSLRESVENTAANPFYSLLKLRVREKIANFSGRVVGISVAGAEQMTNAFLLAKIIKDMRPDIDIVMGGAMLPYLQKVLVNRKAYRELDFVVVKEGETALYRLLSALAEKEDIAKVPNLMYCGPDGKYRLSEAEHREKVNELPAPDYSAMPRDLYFAPPSMVHYLSARGCYWNKCVFCSLACNYGHRYLPRELDKVIDDIVELKQKCGVEYIAFNDESIPPKRLLALSEKIMEAKLGIYWFALMRFENGLTRRHFDRAYRSGLRLISYGLESGNQETLDRMRKGTNVKTMARVLKDSHQAGIWNNTFAISNFPGDSHVNRTIDFIKENSEYIDSICYSVFRLEMHSYAHSHPQELNLELIDVPDDFFGPDYPYVEKIPEGTLHPYRVFCRELANHHFNKDEFFGYDDYNIMSHVIKEGKSAIRRYNQRNIDLKLDLSEMLATGQDFLLHTSPDVTVTEQLAYRQSTAHVIFHEVTCAFLKAAKSEIRFSLFLDKLLELFAVERKVLENDLRQVLPRLAVLGFISIGKVEA